MGLFSFLKGEDDKFKKDLAKASEMMYYIGEKLDSYPQYDDRFLYIQSTIDKIKSGKVKNKFDSLTFVMESIKHLKLDIESRERLQLLE